LHQIQIAHVGVNVSRCPKLISSEIIFEACSPTYDGTLTLQTDRRTDRRHTVA